MSMTNPNIGLGVFLVLTPPPSVTRGTLVYTKFRMLTGFRLTRSLGDVSFTENSTSSFGLAPSLAPQTHQDIEVPSSSSFIPSKNNEMGGKGSEAKGKTSKSQS